MQTGALKAADFTKAGVSLHAPEVECIGKGKAHKSYKVSVEV